MPTPSLLIVPSRWKTGSPGKLYSQIPTNGNGDFNVTGVVTGGTSIGTRVNNIGYIEPITTSGTPRLDYYTSSGTPGCPALLVEPAATNLAFYSEQFDDAYWSKSRVNTSSWANQEIAPNNTLTAEKLTQASGETQAGVVFRSLTVSSGQVHTFSVFVKKGSRDFVALFSNLTGPTLGAYFDINNGTVGTISAGYSAKIENYGNGWFRCSVTATSNSTSHIFFIYGVSANNTFTVPDDGGFQFIWGAQVETGSVATSYIPTTTAAVTRNADVVSVSGAVSGSIGQTEGTIYAEVDVRTLGAAKNILQIDNGTATNRIGLFVDISPTRLTFLMSSAGVTNSLSGTVATGVIKIAASYSSGNVQVFTNGSFLVSGTIATYPIVALNAISVGSRISSGVYGVFLNDRIRATALYTTRLSDADLMLLTMPGNNTYLPQAIWNNYLSRTGNSEVPDCLYTRHADLLDV